MGRFLIIIFISLMAHQSYAKDLTATFQTTYDGKSELSSTQIEFLKTHDIYLVPGLFSELFLQEDHSSPIDFSFMTKDYFGPHVEHLKKLGLNAKRLAFNSASLPLTRKYIGEALRKSQKNGRKTFFITHSLGGLSLIDFLLDNPELKDTISGVAFLQAPFYGTSIATIYMDNPYMVRHWSRPLLPFLNVSLDTIKYLTQEHRVAAMAANEEKIKALLKDIPSFTLTGVLSGQRSIFKPASDLMQYGCVINIWTQCLSTKVNKGPYTLSDGMVPEASTRLSFLDSIVLEGVDHGELVLKIRHRDFEHAELTETLLKMLLNKRKEF